MAEYLQEPLVGLAKQGLKVMLVAHPDACRACRSLQGRIFDPLVAPALPLEECLTPPCRCRYEAYDARSVVSRLLSAGVDAVKEERLDEARDLLYQVVDLDEHNEKAWLWLSGVVEGIDERIVCLESVVAINSHHELARQGLRYLQTRRRELGVGQQTARKIKEAREAIDRIKTRQSKVLTIKETPPAPTRASRETLIGPAAPSAQVLIRRTGEAIEAPKPPVSFPVVFFSVLLAVLLLVFISATLAFVAGILR